MKEIKKEGGGPELQIIVPPTEKYNSVKTNSKVSVKDKKAGSISVQQSTKCQNTHLLCVTHTLNAFLSQYSILNLQMELQGSSLYRKGVASSESCGMRSKP